MNMIKNAKNILYSDSHESANTPNSSDPDALMLLPTNRQPVIADHSGSFCDSFELISKDYCSA
ncbi:Unannotated [Lentimonas sp. CC19]|nr:Unannotated [Lentimonas sp. CC19]CAA6693978.1 Unannotated [Lentimonas sp. CC10]CAA7072219.1 Unannotated [Lentimonas sp. CC11]